MKGTRRHAHVVGLDEREDLLGHRGDAPELVPELQVLAADHLVVQLVHALAELALAVAVAHGCSALLVALSVPDGADPRVPRAAAHDGGGVPGGAAVHGGERQREAHGRRRGRGDPGERALRQHGRPPGRVQPLRLGHPAQQGPVHAQALLLQVQDPGLRLRLLPRRQHGADRGGVELVPALRDRHRQRLPGQAQVLHLHRVAAQGRPRRRGERARHEQQRAEPAQGRGVRPVDAALVRLDIAEKMAKQTLKEDCDPATVRDTALCGAGADICVSVKTSRGPLARGWVKTVDPIMTCYKVVRINFDYWGVQGKAEKIIRDQQRQLFHNTLRQAQCQTDEWFGLTMEDIRRLEAEVVAKLEAKRLTNSANQ
ncbi:hypothetical protein ON010_g2468 [Phytophthora cinnamomi]|nr:hypothetical protein ON010_g2468 [Phytophthora cinnamomi]